MKGLLRTMGVVGLLAGGVMGAGCGVDGKSSAADTHKSPIQSKYQTPAPTEAQSMGPERDMSGGGVNDPHHMPGRDGLGRSLSAYTGAPPDPTGIGGAGQDGDQALPPQQPEDPIQKGAQDPAQQSTTPRGE